MIGLGLDAVPGHWPALASTMTFELYQNPSGSVFVRLLRDRVEQVIPGCPDALCPLAYLC
eukprot:GABW01000493.1.p3 GENE.GABW01000493.1~~GABW01000493.1.p3  ORF type:complete len:60 (-),score=14.10 GABW01000493.1:71-250(-)